MKRTFRNLLAHYYANILILLGAVKKAKRRALRGDYILSIYFHNPSKAEFEFAVKWLKKEGFKFISVDDLKQIIDGDAAFPKGAVLITVDDGWASNVQNLVPVAVIEKVPVTIFVTTEAIESGNYWINYVKKATSLGLGYPGSEDLKKFPNHERLDVLKKIKEQVKLPRESMTICEMKKIAVSPFFTIGGHTVTHPILTNCSEGEVKGEIEGCKATIEEWVGKTTDAFAYPNGSYGIREVKACEGAGYKLAFGNSPGFITRHNLKKRYQIPRIGFFEGGSHAENICRMMGVWHGNSTKIFNW